MIKFNCPKCGKRFKVPDEYAGRKGECPQCKDRILIPGIKNKEQDTSASKQIVKFNCQTCGEQIEVPENLKGKNILCPNCGSNSEVPQKEVSEGEKRTVDELFLAKLKKSCPHCGAPILEVVPRCKHCGGFLNLSYLLPIRDYQTNYFLGTSSLVQKALGVFVMICVVFAVWMFVFRDNVRGTPTEKMLIRLAMNIGDKVPDSGGTRRLRESIDIFESELEKAEVSTEIKTLGREVILRANIVEGLCDQANTELGNMGFGAAFALGGMIAFAEEDLEDAINKFKNAVK